MQQKCNFVVTDSISLDMTIFLLRMQGGSNAAFALSDYSVSVIYACVFLYDG